MRCATVVCSSSFRVWETRASIARRPFADVTRTQSVKPMPIGVRPADPPHLALRNTSVPQTYQIWWWDASGDRQGTTEERPPRGTPVAFGADQPATPPPLQMADLAEREEKKSERPVEREVSDVLAVSRHLEPIAATAANVSRWASLRRRPSEPRAACSVRLATDRRCR